MIEPIETYKDFTIRPSNYRDDYGAWYSFCPLVYYHKNMDDDPEGLAYTYGFAKNIKECKSDIDDIIDLYPELIK